MDMNVNTLQWFINFLIKNLQVGLLKKFIIRNDELIVELHNSIIRKFKKRKLHSSFILL